MEAYPPQYVEHNLPFVLVSGLGEGEHGQSNESAGKRQETGVRLSIESPECLTEQAGRVLHELKTLDGTGAGWNSIALPGPTATVRYRMKMIGRSYSLPPRKAAPLPQSAREGNIVPRTTELHSSLSPLSPGSPVFPDGIFTPLWYSKHQHLVPSLFLAFFNIHANEASRDGQLKQDINTVRSALSGSGFKSRFAAVLLSDRSILHAPDLEDRLGSIRRATNLDLKNGLFFMPPMSSHAEIATFVHDLMRTLQPYCIEYYRELTKHARRKKARGGPPPLANTPIGGSSQATSTSGWNVRYEVKQGVFAEFRQEMDVAERHYSAAIEELFSTEGGVLETTASWSPRWNEARLLCDSTALRIIRCQLWHGQTTGAVQSWQNYKLRMKDLVDRRGKGSNTYGWDAWEGRWANVMAQVLQRVGLPALQKSPKDESGEMTAVPVFVQPEKAMANLDRLPPWNLLHHPGYWYRILANGIRARWEKALAIPEEDRIPPGQTQASAVANRWKNYDVYLVPEPHEELPTNGTGTYDHPAEIRAASVKAVEEFKARRQVRMSEQIQLELAEDLVSANRYSEALQVLVPLWESSTWREDEWEVPFSRLLRLVYDCTSHDKADKNASLIPAVTWELLRVAPADIPDRSLDFGECLGAWSVETRLSLQLHGNNRLCPLTASLTFHDHESSVGETQYCQLRLCYTTTKASTPLKISRLDLQLGGAKTVMIHHDTDVSNGEGSRALSTLPPTQNLDDGNMETRADLTMPQLFARTFDFAIMLREADFWQATELTVVCEGPKFTLTHRIPGESILSHGRWYVEHNGRVESVFLPHANTKGITVFPKPPKMDIQLQNVRDVYYTDERVLLEIGLMNGESEPIRGVITPRIVFGEDQQPLVVSWADVEDAEAARTVTELASAATNHMQLAIEAPPVAGTYTLSLELRYEMISDPGTPLAKLVTLELHFAPAFDAKFIFVPRLHAAPWPSYFDASMRGTENEPEGVQQLWKLGAHLQSLADREVHIHKLELQMLDVQGESSCTIPKPVVEEVQTLKPGEKGVAAFEVVTQKYSLDDRRPSFLVFSILATWSYGEDAKQTTSTITVPHLTIPASEPRVLCTVNDDASTGSYVLQYHLENPSTHFLTFALTMDASESFAFSGPKHRTLSMAPLSRHDVEYHLLPYSDPESHENEGIWITPSLQVVDSYYQKNLRVLPGGDGVRLDSGRDISVWVGKMKTKMKPETKIETEPKTEPKTKP